MISHGLRLRPATLFLLCCMQQGEVKDCSDTLVIDRIRRANAQKHVQNNQTMLPLQSGKAKRYGKVTKSMPCTFFNQECCAQNRFHETRGRCCTSTFVPYPLQTVVGHFPIRKSIVKTKIHRIQKFNGPVEMSIQQPRLVFNTTVHTDNCNTESLAKYQQGVSWWARANSLDHKNGQATYANRVRNSKAVVQPTINERINNGHFRKVSVPRLF